MPDHVDLEFEIQKDALPVAEKLFQMLGKNIDSRIEVGGSHQLFNNPCLIPCNILLENREEYVFFIPKIVVESTAGLPCPLSDILDSSGLEPILRKNLPGSFHELLARNQRAFLLMG